MISETEAEKAHAYKIGEGKCVNPLKEDMGQR